MPMIVETPTPATLLRRVGAETLLAELAGRIDADFAIATATAGKGAQRILADDLFGTAVHCNPIGGDCAGQTELWQLVTGRAPGLGTDAPLIAAAPDPKGLCGGVRGLARP